MKKRHELPNFKKIHVEVDVEKILKIFNDNFENLKEEKDNIVKFLEILEDDDDVQNVYTNAKL